MRIGGEILAVDFYGDKVREKDIIVFSLDNHTLTEGVVYKAFDNGIIAQTIIEKFERTIFLNDHEFMLGKEDVVVEDRSRCKSGVCDTCGNWNDYDGCGTCRYRPCYLETKNIEDCKDCNWKEMD